MGIKYLFSVFLTTAEKNFKYRDRFLGFFGQNRKARHEPIRLNNDSKDACASFLMSLPQLKDSAGLQNIAVFSYPENLQNTLPYF